MSFFISDAMAQAAPAAGPGGGFGGMLIPLIFLVVIFYFMLWRPQSKRQKEHKVLMEGLSKGDEVVTTGGLMGKVTNVTDSYVSIEIAKETEVKMQKNAVMATLPKGTLKGI